MKCIMCQGLLEEKRVHYAEFGVPLGKFTANVCSSCGETFFDAETAKKIQEKSKDLGLFGLVKKTKVAQVGNSLAIRIPKEIVDFIKLKKEKEVRIIPKNAHELTIVV